MSYKNYFRLLSHQIFKKIMMLSILVANIAFAKAQCTGTFELRTFNINANGQITDEQGNTGSYESFFYGNYYFNLPYPPLMVRLTRYIRLE